MCAMRRWVGVAAAVSFVACGGRTMPGTPDPVPPVPLHLGPGTYTLTLDITSGPASLTAGPAFLCTGEVTVTRATVPVILERVDPDLTVQPQMMGASLLLRLQVSGDDRLISGTMMGRATADDGVSVDVFGNTPADPALVSGRADTSSVQGMIIGQVLLAGAGCSTGGHSWGLTPRSGVRAQ
jgi:hypothetical protein